jgi:exonuclease SbcC
MKILRITVNNIASLAGTHSVDFTNEPLRSAGLFGISGATGSGKSSLLDALCLALFDATPRLKQVGQLEEITSGEKQNNSRSLLRRGTAAGFAEVVFVGVDQQTWTARWSVRRSRNQVDGKLQAAEMTLFSGNVPPGQEGTVAAGGKKTLVQNAIVKKIGLTFEQFTRAVLLAQNEFATFLKASDKDRAEILQALTGTQQFETISRAVFARCAVENQEVQKLEARLTGNEPLSAEERAAAETACNIARQLVEQTEAHVESRKLHVAWFDLQKQYQLALKKASEQLQLTTNQQAGGAQRRLELQHTEVALREGQSLWKANADGAANVDAAKKAVANATAERDSQVESLRKSKEILATTKQKTKLAASQLADAQPQLKTARQLDATLKPLQDRLTKAESAATAAKEKQQTAALNLNDATNQRTDFLSNQKELKATLDQLSRFAPFVTDSAKWQHLLSDAIATASDADTTNRLLAEVTERRSKQQTELTAKQDAARKAQQQWKDAEQQLRTAETEEQQFDAERLALQRDECDRNFDLLTSLQQELEQQQELTTEAVELKSELVELAKCQQEEFHALQTLIDTQVPQATQAVTVAANQLQLIEATVDDHSKRLRATLQDDQPCPVCGSLEHPFGQHSPDSDTVAVKAAQQNVRDLEQHRDTLKEDRQRLQLSVGARADTISKQSDRQAVLVEQCQTFEFKNSDALVVIEVLAELSAERLESVQQRLKTCHDTRESLRQQTKKHNQAAEQTQTCRAAELARRNTLETLRTACTASEKTLSEIDIDFSSKQTFSQSVSQRQKDAIIALGDLWSGLPNAKEQFETDSQKFSGEFEASTNDYQRISAELTTLAADIKACESRLAPVKEAATQAGQVFLDCERDSQAAAAAQENLLNERQQFFDGRPADEVETELTAQLKAASKSVEEQTDVHHKTDKAFQSAEQNLLNATKAADLATAAEQTANDQLAYWLKKFAERFSRSLTTEQMQQMLERGEQWLTIERNHLKQLDDHVTEAKSTSNARRQQLEEHNNKRPAPDEEADVLKALTTLRTELKEAKRNETDTTAVLSSDYKRRQDNQRLADQLIKQQTIADPWQKLNDLIGSKEGDKFRMIAQRRTLDVLLSYANHQLGLLAARYRLERLPESLNLIVIDEHMGDERRSVHSLSGGESFLVSLSLALGLASLTSSRLKIESLFIDEGFGSLDPETLNTAMSALMHLEAQGRKVGVISHVTEMTDAIPVQVKVVKRRGGASKIEIPGMSEPTSVELPVASTNQTVDVDSLASQIVSILERERLTGKLKVTNHLLRTELACTASDFKSAQKILADRVSVEGRSLRLN